MKRIVLFMFLLLPLLATSQTLSVADFKMNEHDLTAVNEATKVIDDNGEICALIKIETTQKGFYFDGGTIGIVKSDESKIGEIWVYVPPGLQRITIQHPQLGILRDYYFPERLQSARTYIMKLITGTVEQVVNQKRTSQVFVLTFKPKDAMVEIDGTMVETDDGTYSGVLSFGKHQYRISSKDYHTEVGVVEIGEQKVVKDIALNPAFGWIEVKGLNGASVYIDGKKVGAVPMKSDPVASGSHDVRVMKDKYLPHREQVMVNDNTITTITPSLTANFTTVNLKTTGDAEIWVNGEMKGSGSVAVDLVPGEYSFETKKASHRGQSVVRNITMSSGGIIEIPAPVAIIGSLMVNIKPVGAKVTVDGKSVGETPVILDNVLVGQHEVVVSKAGCAERREIVTVTEGQTSTLEGRLSEGQDVRLWCGVSSARWTVDGVDRGIGAEITVNLSYAEHSVEIKAEEYRDCSERFIVSTGTTYQSFAIQKINRDIETITVNGVTFNMRRVEGGTFQMGSYNGESYEKPVHSVTLSDYFIGETEVTQALWKAVMGTNPSYNKGDNLPVEQVSWNDCQEFISKLYQLTGRRFALPTEAQWEYAARGGNKSQGYEYSGSNNLDNVGWNWNNSGYRKTTGDWSDPRQIDRNNCKTHPVGMKQANELGLYDMSGNVYEWCQDWYDSYSSSSQSDPTGPSSGSSRVYRGGCWFSYASYCRSAYRYKGSPGDGSLSVGFRLVLLF